MSRWDRAFPQRRGAFEKLRRHILRNYVGTSARFPVHLWSVSGRATRTNNAAESSHARPNASVRVSGEVSLDLFLFAIQTQMKNTSREIAAGCQPHTRAIYRRRNELLAVELEELLNGRLGLFQFLDHCSSVMNVNNLADAAMFREHRAAEFKDLGDMLWAERNRQATEHAAVELHRRLWPGVERPASEILATVRYWAFQTEECQSDLGVVEDDSTLSMAPTMAPTSFLEIREAVERGERRLKRSGLNKR